MSVRGAKSMRRIATMFVPKAGMTTRNRAAVKAIMLTTMIVAAVIV
jgi:hypothetical protein